MKASDLKPGDTVDGWTVTAMERTGRLIEDALSRMGGDYTVTHVLLTIELDVCNNYGAPVATRHRRTWFPTDEEVSS
jgi:hypothetical protein